MLHNAHLTLFFGLISSLVFGQGKLIDSLKTRLASEDSVDLQVQLNIAIADQFQNPNKKITYVRQALKLSQKGSKTSQIEAYFNMAITNGMLGRLDSSEYFFREGLHLAQELNDSTYLSGIFNGLGNVSRMQGKLEEALTNYQNALEYGVNAEKIWRADVYTNIGGVYYHLGDFHSVLEAVKKARSTYKQFEDKNNISYTSNLLSIAFRGLNQFDSADFYNKEALEMLIKAKDTVQIIYNYINAQHIQSELRNYNKVIELATETFKLAEQFGERDPQISSKLQLAYSHLILGDVEKAKQNAEDAYDLIIQYDFRSRLHEYYSMMTIIEAANGNYGELDGYFRMEKEFSDSLRSKDIRDKVSELNIKYKSTKKQQEIDRLNAQQEIKNLELGKARTRNIFLMIISILGLVLFTTVWIFYRQKIKITKELEEANRSKDRLFSIIGHDLKNPLNAIISITSSLEKNHKIIPEEQLDTFIRHLDSSAKKLLGLLQNLLQWSVSQSGALNFEPININLSSVMKETMDLFRMDVEAKSLQISTEINPDLMVHADYKMLFTIIRNLFSNAVKFTRKGGNIKLTAKQEPGFISLSISDNGVGMNEEQKKNLFTGSLSKSTSGTGLGLALCKEFVEKNGGKITFISEEGRGSTFTFTVPQSI